MNQNLFCAMWIFIGLIATFEEKKFIRFSYIFIMVACIIGLKLGY